MRVVLTIFATLILSGCVDARGKALQDQYCYDKGGVFEYVSETGGFSFGYCMDNTQFTYNTVRKLGLRPEFYPK